MPMPYNENMSEGLVVLATLPSASQTTGAKAVGPFTIKSMNRVLFIIDVGTLGSSATIDFQIQSSATQGGSYVLVPGTAITQITAGASNLVLVELKMETLAILGVGPWIKGVLTPGTAASQGSVIALGSPKYSPGSDYNVVTPAQILVA